MQGHGPRSISVVLRAQGRSPQVLSSTAPMASRFKYHSVMPQQGCPVFRPVGCNRPSFGFPPHQISIGQAPLHSFDANVINVVAHFTCKNADFCHGAGFWPQVRIRLWKELRTPCHSCLGDISSAARASRPCVQSARRRQQVSGERMPLHDYIHASS